MPRKKTSSQYSGMASPQMDRELGTSLQRKLSDMQENIRILEAQVKDAKIQQTVAPVEEYDDSIITGKFNRLDAEILQLKGQVLTNLQNIQKLFSWWDSFNYLFRARFASGDPRTGTGDIEIMPGILSLWDGAVWTAEQTISSSTLASLATSSNTCFYLKYVVSTGAESIVAAPCADKEQFLPEYSNTTGAYYIPLVLILKDSDDVITLYQVQAGAWRPKYIQADELNVRPIFSDPTASSFPTINTVYVSAGSIMIDQTEVTISADTLSITAESLVYVDVAPDGATDYDISIETVAYGSSLTPTAGHVYFPVGRVLWDTGNSQIVGVDQYVYEPLYFGWLVP